MAKQPTLKSILGNEPTEKGGVEPRMTTSIDRSVWVPVSLAGFSMGSRLSGPDRHAVASAAQYAEDQWKRRQWDAVMRNVAAAPALRADVVEPLEALSHACD